jgi:hypothetical protein
MSYVLCIVHISIVIDKYFLSNNTLKTVPEICKTVQIQNQYQNQINAIF